MADSSAMASLLPHNVIAFVPHGAQVDVHRHHCFQIAMSVQADFDCRLGNRMYHGMKGFIINQNIPHSCAAQHTSVINYFIDAESAYGRRLKQLLDGRATIDIAPMFTPA